MKKDETIEMEREVVEQLIELAMDEGKVDFHPLVEDKNERLLWLTGEIDEEVVELTKSIVRWNMEDLKEEPDNRKPIRVLIDSPGGLLEQALSLYDVIVTSKTPVYTVNMGQAASAASLIFSAGHERAALPGSVFLFHEGEGGASGTYIQAKQRMQHYEHLVAQLKQCLTKGFSLEGDIEKEFCKKMERDDWYLYTSPISDSEEGVSKYNLTTVSYESIMY